MEKVLQQIDQYRKEIDQWVIASAEDLENYRIRFLGTKGIVKALFGEMKNVPVESKRSFGQVLNDFKQLAETKYEDHKGLTADPGAEGPAIDLTLPGDALTPGT